jgi:hypothetical protein
MAEEGGGMMDEEKTKTLAAQLAAKMREAAWDVLADNDLFWEAVDENLADWFENSKTERAAVEIGNPNGPSVLVTLEGSYVVLRQPVVVLPPEDYIYDVRALRDDEGGRAAAEESRLAAMAWRKFADEIESMAREAEHLAGLRDD